MKKLIYIISASLLLLTGCNDWLDVSSKFEVREDDMFSTEEGFKSALTGVYIKIAAEPLYGKNVSMVLPEFITRHWNLTTTADQTGGDYGFYNHDYTTKGAEEVIKKVWERYYNAVVQVNNILERLEDTDVRFTYGNRNLIKGEALGLRAFLQFDVLRFFGPVPSLATDATLTVPYLDEVTKDPNLAVAQSWAQIKEKIFRVLDEAEALLVDDPFTKARYADLNKLFSGPDYVPDDEWHYYRQTRFNYYAVWAMKARAYLWFGDKPNAVKYAKMVIEEENPNGTSKFALATQSYLNASMAGYTAPGRSLILECENIFQVHNSKHQSIIENNYKSSKPRFIQTSTGFSSVYETNVNSNDIRSRTDVYWGNVVVGGLSTLHYFKYIGNGTIEAKNRIPVIRLSELYLLLIECLDNTEANAYMEEFRIARNLARNYLDDPFSDSDKFSILEKEYRKDFWAEGQMFHFYKRRNVSEFNFPAVETVSPAIYVIPKPRGQIEFE